MYAESHNFESKPECCTAIKRAKWILEEGLIRDDAD